MHDRGLRALSRRPGKIQNRHRPGSLRPKNSTAAVAPTHINTTIDFKERRRRLHQATPLPHRQAQRASCPPASFLKGPRRPARAADDIYAVFDAKPGAQYDTRELLDCIVDADSLDEYKSDFGGSILCAYATINAVPCGIVANQKKLTQRKMPGGKAGPSYSVNMPGVIYDDSADKAARFIMDCNQRKIPLIFIHDTTGFMVGRDSEQQGIAPLRRPMVNAMSNCMSSPRSSSSSAAHTARERYAMRPRASTPSSPSPGQLTPLYARHGRAQASGTLAMIENAPANARAKRSTKAIPQSRRRLLQRAAGHPPRRAAAGSTASSSPQHPRRLAAAAAMTTNWDYSPEFKTGVLQV
ncbi:MAG: carboxyl transferase domain-containing protein [Phycisphaerales bacterium]